MKHPAPAMMKTYSSAKHGNTDKANRTKASKKIKYIVVHYTGSKASAKNNCIYFAREGAEANASADFFIDKDGTIWKYNQPTKAYSWHCGDGHGKYGITNSNSVGIEVVSAGEEYTYRQKLALKKLVLYLMEYFSVPADHVVRHYDASRKSCPLAYSGSLSTTKGRKWKKLRAYITTD